MPTEFGTYPFELPPLPFAYDALEPYIDEETMRYHYDGHFATYIRKLNTALEPYAFLQNMSLEELLCAGSTLPEDAYEDILKNAGGVYNHALFFSILAPASESVHEPDGKLLEAIEGFYGSFEHFKETFSKSAADVFGSGWTVLVSDSIGNLDIRNVANQDVLLCEGLEPVILFDIWEHAYYLKYKNDRVQFIDNLWNVIRFK
ncbi:MAG: superoxide dismutase [Oscillospiraceae bacterium]|jgi:Fe-Mn family superoxide dismutase|nr:superoxide dismutase [Oscillospiraceae bacterium]